MSAMTDLKALSGKLFIDGNHRVSTATDAFPVVDPATEEIVGRGAGGTDAEGAAARAAEEPAGGVPDGTDAEVDEASAVANQAQKKWNRVNPLRRAELLHEVA